MVRSGSAKQVLGIKIWFIALQTRPGNLSPLSVDWLAHLQSSLTGRVTVKERVCIVLVSRRMTHKERRETKEDSQTNKRA
jgi:hypothetical protein